MNNLIGGSCGAGTQNSIDPDRAQTNASAFRNIPGKNAPPSMADHRKGVPTVPSTPTTRKNLLKKSF